VHGTDVLLSNGLGILETKSQHALGSRARDQFNGLNDALYNLVLDARVLSLSVLTDKNSINVVVRCLVTRDGSAGTDIGEEIEGPAEGKVERDVTLANRRLRGC
jgi:hypothetical protein